MKGAGRAASSARDKDLLRRLCRHVLACLPTRGELLLGIPAWGLAMMVSAYLALLARNAAQTFHLLAILLLFFSGAALAWPIALTLARLVSTGRPSETRFAAYFVCLTILTIALTAFIFAMQYRLFYTQWHSPFGTRIWMYQFVFTSAAAVYQFTVMGVRLYLPLGFGFLVAASVWLSGRHDIRR